MPEGICGNTLKFEPSRPSIAPRGPNLWPFNVFIGLGKAQRARSPRSLSGQHLSFLEVLGVCLAVIVLSGAHCYRERLERTFCSHRCCGSHWFRVG